MKKLTLALMLVLVMGFSVTSMAEEEEEGWYNKVKLFGYVDFRAEYYTSTFADDAGTGELDEDGELVPGTFDDEGISQSDLYVYEAAIGAEVEMNDYVSGLVTIAWDEFAFEDGSEIFVDEAWIHLQYPWVVTPYAVLGRAYVPVGNYATFGISDGLLYTLTETSQSTIGIGAEMSWFDASVWLFNGGFDRTDSDGDPVDNLVDDWAVRVDVFPLAFQDRFELSVGGYLLSDATETSQEIGGLLAGNYEDNVPLYGAYLYGMFPFTDIVGLGVNLEYATTGKLEKENYTNAAGDETSISAFLGELAVFLLDQRLSLGARYEFVDGIDMFEAVYTGQDDFEPVRYSAVAPFVSGQPFEFLRLAMEYRYGWDNEDNKDGLFQFQTVLEF